MGPTPPRRPGQDPDREVKYWLVTLAILLMFTIAFVLASI